MVKYINRYNDEYTFTLDSEGNILWEGNFQWCRFGWPNDYTKAYAAYLKDHEGIDEELILSLEQFKQDVHKYIDNQHLYPEYVKLVESLTDQISMVDPSGGPYICREYPMEQFGEEFKGMVVKDFKPIETGYKIIVK
jgi:hypothetical protein